MKQVGPCGPEKIQKTIEADEVRALYNKTPGFSVEPYMKSSKTCSTFSDLNVQNECNGQTCNEIITKYTGGSGERAPLEEERAENFEVEGQLGSNKYQTYIFLQGDTWGNRGNIRNNFRSGIVFLEK